METLNYFQNIGGKNTLFHQKASSINPENQNVLTIGSQKIENNFTANSQSFFLPLISTDFRYFMVTTCVFDHCINYYGTGGAISCKSDFGITYILNSNFNSCFSNVSSGAIFSISKNVTCEGNCFFNCSSSNNCGCSFLQFRFGCMNKFGLYSCDNDKNFAGGSSLKFYGTNNMDQISDGNITSCKFGASSAIVCDNFDISDIVRSIFYNNSCTTSLIKSNTTMSTIQIINVYFGNNSVQSFFNFRNEVSAIQINAAKWMDNTFSEIFDYFCDYEGMIFGNCFFDFDKPKIYVQYISCFFNTSYRATPKINFQPSYVCNLKAQKPKDPGFLSTPVGIAVTTMSIALVLVIIILIAIIMYRKKKPEVKESDRFYTDEYFSHLISRNPLIVEDEG